jgi:hypothetical protein
MLNVHGLDEWIRDLAKAAKPDTEHLDDSARDAFDDTQNRVHTISGALKASGSLEINAGSTSWEATVEYGGPEGSECDYAIFEQRRGGSHDFLANVPKYEDAIDEAITKMVDL